MMVRCFNQDGTGHRDYDFSRMTSPPALRDALIGAFVRRTAPGAGLTSFNSFQNSHTILVLFDRYLATLPRRPRSMEQVAAAHFDGFYEHRRSLVASAAMDLAELRRVLLKAQGASEALAARLAGPMPKRHLFNARHSYSRAEFRRVAEAARATLREAAARIRENRELLRAFRAGELLPGKDIHLVRRLQILDHVDRFADVPRRVATAGWNPGSLTPHPWVHMRGTVKELVGWLHLSIEELAAAAVLLTVMTGENAGVILNTPAAHHRADGHAGGTATAIVGLRKPRRGRRAHMSLALSQIPDWISVPDSVGEVSARDELHTPFGLYALLHELTAGSRALAGGNRLMIGYFASGGRGTGRGIRPLEQAHFSFNALARRHGLLNDPEVGEDGRELEATPMALRLDRLRMTFIELHQKPVAHTERTAATAYLARNRGNVAEYRRVVADALEAEVAKARTRGLVTSLSAEDIRRAAADPEAVAAEHGLDVATLRRMLAGQLDTVLAACSDHTGGPHAPAGQPCPASFLLCLSCECARALPHHLTLQVLIHDRLAERRLQMDALDWARRFAGPHAQLADLLARHDGAVVADARGRIGAGEEALAARFLGRELDLR
ncbi:hypothetical protein ACFV7Q_16160 [Streptomyces sp. NPDC059851]|uniref:hypothetical protein n=1 Tax=Streptomyces sp. NPDC059851 TaxID=3346971 RepID=UPI0036567C7B